MGGSGKLIDLSIPEEHAYELSDAIDFMVEYKNIFCHYPERLKALEAIQQLIKEATCIKGITVTL